jgi:hypothetical protein
MGAQQCIGSIKAISRPKTNFGPDLGEQLHQQVLCIKALRAFMVCIRSASARRTHAAIIEMPISTTRWELALALP